MARKAKARVNFRHVILRVEDATTEALHAMALQIEGTAKRNIVGNDQVDTGFMLHSIYTASDAGDTFWKTWSLIGEGEFFGRKSGKRKAVSKAERVNLPNLFSAALVHVSAGYAIYQEMMAPFLRPAAQEVAGQAEKIAKSVYRGALHD